MMNAEPLLGALLGLALLAFAGRCLLAWLPAGDPGGHHPRELPATWAASHLLGWIAFHTLGGLVGEFELRFGWLTFVVPFALLGGARLLTLPAAMSPRHADREPRPTAWTRLVLAALGTVLVLLFVHAVRAGELAHPAATLEAWRARSPYEAYVLRLARPAHVAALVILFGRGLAGFSMGPGPRHAAALALGLLPIFWSSGRAGPDSSHVGTAGAMGIALIDTQLTLAFGAGIAFGATWLRRADRRALALACLAFAHCIGAAHAGAPLGIAGLLALVLGLHRNAYRLALPWMLFGLALVALPHRIVGLVLEMVQCPRAELGTSSSLADLTPEHLFRAVLDWRRGGPVWLAAPLGLLLYLARHRQRADRAAAWFVLQAALLALVLHTGLAAAQGCLTGVDGLGWGGVLLAALPAAATLLALGTVPPDRRGAADAVDDASHGRSP